MRIINIFFTIGIFVFLMIFMVHDVSAAITLDNKSSADTGTNPKNTLSWTHTVAGDDRILIVGISMRSDATVTDVTYNNSELTRIAEKSESTSARVSLWILIDPPTGTGVISVYLSDVARFVAGAHSYTGVDLSAPLGIPNVSSGSRMTEATLEISSAANEVVVDVIARRGDILSNNITAGSSQTVTWNTQTKNNSHTIGITGGGSYSQGMINKIMRWTWSRARAWAMAGISLKPKIVLPPEPDPDPDPTVDNESPTVPQNLTGEAISAFEVLLTWEASDDNTGVSGYKIYRDGQLIASTADTAFSGFGVVGNSTYIYTVTSFDEAGNESGHSNSATIVTPPEPDLVPPNSITDLDVINITQTSVDLIWTATGDDGDTGQASYYDIRYSTVSINEDNWGSALQITDAFLPAISGTSERFTVTGLVPETHYYFAVKVIDEEGNTSDLSNVTETITQEIAFAVSLSVEQLTGEAPLKKIDLVATVTGSVGTGIHYTFYCDRSDDGLDIIEPYNLRREASNSTIEAATDLCDYETEGVYIAKVIAEKGDQVVQNRVEIVVSGAKTANKSIGKTPVSSGSGGGGFIGDITSPQPVTNVQIEFRENKLFIKWENPTNIDFAGVLLVRKENEIPTSTSDGIKLFEGYVQDFTDNILSNGKTYYYAIYAYDRKPNFSQPVTFKIVFQADDGVTNEMNKIEVTEIVNNGNIDLESNSNSNRLPDYKSIIFTKTLFYGIRSNEVIKLQEYLSLDPVLYPEGLVTGYFGLLTRKAVQRFQCGYEIICRGYSNTTGFGRVGPKTRVKLNELINN